MFPMKTGISNNTVTDNNIIFVQSLVCSALNEIAKKAILDTSILMFHQLEVQVYYNNDRGIEIPLDSNDQLIVYSPEEEKLIRNSLRNIVWKYHILHPHGLVGRLTPLINYINSGIDIPEQVLNTDLFLKTVVQNHSLYTEAVKSGNINNMMNNIINFDHIENITDEQYTQMLLDSRNDGNAHVDTVIYEDDTVQCGCDYCDKFFQVMDIDIDYNNLNYLQRIMIQNF